jgi:hypothetical protein
MQEYKTSIAPYTTTHQPRWVRGAWSTLTKDTGRWQEAQAVPHYRSIPTPRTKTPSKVGTTGTLEHTGCRFGVIRIKMQEYEWSMSIYCYASSMSYAYTMSPFDSVFHRYVDMSTRCLINANQGHRQVTGSTGSTTLPLHTHTEDKDTFHGGYDRNERN